LAYGDEQCIVTFLVLSVNNELSNRE